MELTVKGRLEVPSSEPLEMEEKCVQGPVSEHSTKGLEGLLGSIEAIRQRTQEEITKVVIETTNGKDSEMVEKMYGEEGAEGEVEEDGRKQGGGSGNKPPKKKKKQEHGS